MYLTIIIEEHDLFFQLSWKRSVTSASVHSVLQLITAVLISNCSLSCVRGFSVCLVLLGLIEHLVYLVYDRDFGLLLICFVLLQHLQSILLLYALRLPGCVWPPLLLLLDLLAKFCFSLPLPGLELRVDFLGLLQVSNFLKLLVKEWALYFSNQDHWVLWAEKPLIPSLSALPKQLIFLLIDPLEVVLDSFFVWLIVAGQ